MKNPIRKYRDMSYEQKTLLITVTGLCISAVLAAGKFVIGLLTDYNLCGVAVYTAAILLSKLECVLGIKNDKKSFKQSNLLISVFLFISSVIYVCFMCRMFFTGRAAKQYSINYVLLLALISFTELGFAIYGLIRTRSKGYLYRNIKIINLCIALIALLTTQMTILDFTASADMKFYNAYTGIGVGVFIAACAVYIFIAPYVCVTGRERNAFTLADVTLNKLVDMTKPTVSLTLCASRIYGSYVYIAAVGGKVVDGEIVRESSLWKRMRLPLKILCCILSEILIFVWLAGRAVFFLRSVNLPRRLEKRMNSNGFLKIA